MISETQKTLNWYAVKVFFNRYKAICSEFESAGVRLYVQDVIPSLVFLQCDETFIRKVRTEYWQQLKVYMNIEKSQPYAIPEKEMTSFILITSNGKDGLLFLGDDLPEYHLGDRVRVKDGPFKGAEGHIKRIKKDRRLIVSINGVAAVATTFIHPSLLEIVAEETENTENC